jgi:arsenate reductase
MLKMYGLKNCDTCRKARKWLDAEGISHTFIDVRAGDFTATDVARWAKTVSVDVLLNKRGTTWRGLSAGDQAEAETPSGAVALMGAHPALIKRPVFEMSDGIYVGFTDDVKAALK